MGELGLNKIFGGLLAILLAVLGLREVSYMMFGGGHHHSHEYESVNEWAKKNFAYYMEMAEADASGGPVEEEVYDLGLLLAGADLSAGERNFNAQCKTCHTIEQGGNNGTGPNLYGIIGASKGAVAGFGYSGALDRTDGNWSYENMDNWLRAPSTYAAGTSMAFAGLRRDPQRASVLAYLASYSPDAPAAPEPLPTETAEAISEEVVEAGTDALETAADVGADGTGVIEVPTEAIDASVEAAEDAVETAVEATEN